MTRRSADRSPACSTVAMSSRANWSVWKLEGRMRFASINV